MAPLDTSIPLPDISGGDPAGENLEFDPAFAELERLAQGKPEQQYGSTIVPAEEPEWKEVIAAARALMERTYDLRVMAQLAVARLHREGLGGFAEVLGLVRQVLETRWAEVHPQLDPEDDNDPTLRANALLSLADPVRVIRLLRTLPLARSPRTGTVSWRDISIATGMLEVDEDTPKMTEAAVAGTFREADPALVEALRAALAQAIGHSVAIPEVFDGNAGSGTGPGLTDLTKLLRDMLRMVDNYAAAGVPDLEPEAAEDAGTGSAATLAPARSPMVASIATMGPPTNRQDAMRLLELVIEFYERHEPSSPVPLVVARARRMAEMSFIDILRDMAPDGLSQAEMVTGRTDT